MNDNDWNMHASRTSDLILFSLGSTKTPVFRRFLKIDIFIVLETGQNGALLQTNRLKDHLVWLVG
jgi:hypothetical protein